MKSKFSAIKLFLILSITITLLSCASTQNTSDVQHTLNDSDFIPEEFIWQPVTEGIERFDFENPDIPLVYHMVKINLAKENLKLVYYPDENTKKSGSGQFKGMKTERFAKNNDCVVAINASPFSGKLFKKKIAGIHSFNKKEFSGTNNHYAAIAFSEDSNNSGYKAEIIPNQDQRCINNFDFSFGGFFVVLQNGEIDNSFKQIYDSRSGAGISDNGKTLYLLAVEGENKNHSIGLTYPQCGKIFYAAGCTDALELDGGGSTQICINGKSVLTYKAFRIQANSFGFIIL